MSNGFDRRLFDRMQFEPVTDEIDVKEELHGCAEFFPKVKAPKWSVRGLTGEELARVRTAEQTADNIDAVIEGLTGRVKEKADAIRALIGMGGNVPGEHVKRLHMLVYGSVDPEVDHPFAVRFADARPLPFLVLTNRIIQLTHEGKTAKNPEGSGETPSSEPV